MAGRTEHRKRHRTKRNIDNRNDKTDLFVKEGVGTAVTTAAGDSYLGAYALALGADDRFIGEFSAIPALISSVLQLLSSKLFHKRKLVVVGGVALSLLVWMGIVLLTAMPTQNALTLLMIYVIVYTSIKGIVAPLWASWFGDYLNRSTLGEIVGKRDAVVSTVSAVISVGAGYFLTLFDQTNVLVGFAVLFSLAALGRLMSLVYLMKIPENPVPEGFTNIKTSEPKRVQSNKRNSTRMKNSTLTQTKHKYRVRLFLIYASLLFLVVTIASPFFIIYELKILKLTYLQYGALILTSALSRYFSSKYWGNMIDKYSSKTVTLAGGIIVASHVFIYVLLPRFEWLLLASVLSGFGWSAHDVGGFSYIMSHSNKKSRAEYVAIYNFLFGITRFIGTNLGLLLIDKFETVPFLGLTGVAGVIAFSGLLRLLVAVTFIPILKDHGIKHEGRLIVAMLTEYPVRSITHLIFHHYHYSHETVKHMTK
ncbi:MFS transporter [Candidatus Micrarchaeota archaeon]|nr:MFS transporter [Candidatus Micrarchaeota archaeon]